MFNYAQAFGGGWWRDFDCSRFSHQGRTERRLRWAGAFNSTLAQSARCEAETVAVLEMGLLESTSIFGESHSRSLENLKMVLRIRWKSSKPGSGGNLFFIGFLISCYLEHLFLVYLSVKGRLSFRK